MTIIDGKKIRDQILEKVKSEVALLPFKPVFCDVLVGDDPVSAQYVDMKARTAERVGIHFHKAVFPVSISTEDLVKEIKVLNKIENMCGIIVQLPIPASINKKAVLDSIDPRLDVDCLGAVASERFYKNYNSETDLAFPTALACMALLDSLNLELKGKYITGNMIKSGAVLIDAGTSEDAKKPLNEQGLPLLKKAQTIVGDVDFESVKNVAGYISPVPGGVGPVTVAMLLNNVLKVAKSKTHPHPPPHGGGGWRVSTKTFF